jgi:hypothetical protein
MVVKSRLTWQVKLRSGSVRVLKKNGEKIDLTWPVKNLGWHMTKWIQDIKYKSKTCWLFKKN